MARAREKKPSQKSCIKSPDKAPKGGTAEAADAVASGMSVNHSDLLLRAEETLLKQHPNTSADVQKSDH